MASLSLFMVWFFVLASVSMGRDLGDQSEMEMEEGELLGLFEVMGSLADEPGWAEVHPQPCTDTPWPGVECEIGADPPIFHVTTIHIGPDVAFPPCKPSAQISHSLLKLPFLRTLSIFNCFVTSPPVTLSPTLFAALSSLEHLSLQSNPSLSGLVPPTLANMSKLRVLSLSQNNLQGNIPPELGRLVDLEQLDLSYNNLSGEIPEQIGGLKSLAILDLSSNNLEGSLPTSLGQLQFLQKLDLCSNRLHGNIPPEIGNLNRLVLLDLSHNIIHGPIPETLSGLQQLLYITLDYNPINSLTPYFVGSLKRLTSISFSVCGLIGTVPNVLSSLKNLTALSLDNNNLTGTIPPNLVSLPNLNQLNLSHNNLSGELPFTEEFINRLGKRLDVRRNSSLCISYNLSKKNIKSYLQMPSCLPADDFNGSNPSFYHGQMMSSRAPFEHPHFISTCFVLFNMLSFL